MDVFPSIRDQGTFFFTRARVGARVRSLVGAVAFSGLAAMSLRASSQEKAIADLKTGDKARKFEAVETLKKNRTRQANDALAQSLAAEKDPHLKLALLDGLAAAGDAGHVPAIAVMLGDPLPSIRQRAAQVLGILRGPKAVEAVGKAIATEKDPAVKKRMMEIFEQMTKEAE